ncbi:MAG: hypothetical protein IT556_07805 [Acetobacteraceae bacterium]|nr:hypothetical protein [Acetobacteraceae bacterium]
MSITSNPLDLAIETFDRSGKGNVLYKALAHPVGAERLTALFAGLGAAGKLVLYDPRAEAAQLAALSGLAQLPIAGVYGQDLADIGSTRLGHVVQPATALAASGAATVLLTSFDAGRQAAQVAPLLAKGTRLVTLDEARIPDEFLTNPRRYLDPLNFATALAFFRDADGLSTRLVSADYWGGYGAGRPRRLFCRLFDGAGRKLADWWEDAPEGGTVLLSIDSRAVRARFGLPAFCGQMFVHVVGAAGHDIVKYALDVIGTGRPDLSCTHDANPWPASLYAGLPAPRPDERVVLWLQNSHPKPMPAGAVRLRPMGETREAAVATELGPFATAEIDAGALLPGLAWPRQIEILAGRHMVRPRYEVVRPTRRHIAHVNVERAELKPDPAIPTLSALGKGFILPFPVLPPALYRTHVQPTPMAAAQADLPLLLSLYDAAGALVGERFLGRLARSHALAVDLDGLGAAGLGNGFGHGELSYDFRDGGGADGWLHALFRWERRDGPHQAESSFGSHVFNTILTWKGEPQSYAGPPPGLSTRLFLRLGEPAHQTLCHLIYPASDPTWHDYSTTALELHDALGREIAREDVAIARSGSLLWRPGEVFGGRWANRAAGGYVLIRDTTCRLFGYHGLEGADGTFCLDHMFGF